jgi:hypothetical protein
LVALSLEQDQRQPFKTVPKETRLQLPLSCQAVPSHLDYRDGYSEGEIRIVLVLPKQLSQ